MLLSILYIYYQIGTTDYEILLSFLFLKLSKKYCGFLFLFLLLLKSLCCLFIYSCPRLMLKLQTTSSGYTSRDFAKTRNIWFY